MPHKYFSKVLCKEFIYTCTLIFSFNTNHAKNVSIGIEMISFFKTAAQIFYKSTSYKNGDKVEILPTIPTTYNLFRTDLVDRDNGYNYKHNLKWSLITWKRTNYIVNVNTSNYLEQKKGTYVIGEGKVVNTQKIISSCWINVNFLHNIFENKKNERDCFCYGVGINYSKMSIYLREYTNPNKLKKSKLKNEEYTIYQHYIWGNFSILGKYAFSKHFSIATTISVRFLILRIRKIGDYEGESTIVNGEITGYDCYSPKRFSLLDSPTLNMTFYFEI